MQASLPPMTASFRLRVPNRTGKDRLGRRWWVWRTRLLPDDLWDAIAPLLLPPRPRGKGGRRPIEDRAALTGILFVLRSGLPWEMLPAEMGCGCGMSCWRRLRAGLCRALRAKASRAARNSGVTAGSSILLKAQDEGTHAWFNRFRHQPTVPSRPSIARGPAPAVPVPGSVPSGTGRRILARWQRHRAPHGTPHGTLWGTLRVRRSHRGRAARHGCRGLTGDTGGEGAGRTPPGADHRQKCSLTPPPTSSGTSIAPL